MLSRRSEEVSDETTNEESTEQLAEPVPRSDVGLDGVTVRRQPPDEDTAGVYIIAMVAGVSAAATVGLIAFGIGWYK